MQSSIPKMHSKLKLIALRHITRQISLLMTESSRLICNRRRHCRLSLLHPLNAKYLPSKTRTSRRSILILDSNKREPGSRVISKGNPRSLESSRPRAPRAAITSTQTWRASCRRSRAHHWWIMMRVRLEFHRYSHRNRGELLRLPGISECAKMQK